jgi:hypothetical protein
MSTLSLDPAVSLFEPSARTAAVTTAAPARSPLPARSAPAARRVATAETATRHGRRPARPHAAHARRAAASSLPRAVARTVQPVVLRALGTSVAAAVVTWALVANDGGDAASVAAMSVRGLAAAAVICAAWGFQDRSRLGALGTTRTWYGTAFVLAVAHTAWFSTTAPGRFQDHLGVVAGLFTLDVVLVVVPALLGARAGRPEGAAA